MRTQEWTQRDGTPIRICDMGDRHLIYTIRMLRRVHRARQLMALGSPEPQGEQAGYAWDAAVTNLMASDSEHPLYDDLCDEAADRGLTVL